MAPTLPHAARNAGLLAVTGLAAVTLAGCDTSVPNQLDFSDTEKVKITEIVIGSGSGSGDVTVKTAAISDTRIKRVVRYRGVEPARSYRLDGTVLHVDTDCGDDCSVSYDIVAPTGVAVRGEVTSGDIDLTAVATADVRISSGNIRVTGATGQVRAEASSGGIAVTDVAGPTRLVATSGEITGRGLGRAPVNAEVSSGDIDLELTTAGPVTAHATSGNVTVRVPDGRYRVRSNVDSGDERVGIQDDPTATVLLDVDVTSGDLVIARR
jgi:hypothetical protein